ncbi:mandelate racemase/muconate lactonizing enzyme family protein [Streptomyces sp. NPDC002666]
MKISSVRSVLLGYDTAGDPPLEWVGGRFSSWDAALVEVRLDSGATGLGEVAQGTMAAEAVPGLLDALRRYLPSHDLPAVELGDYLRDRTRFWARGGISSGVVAALEIACLDAESKEAGLPLWQHLRGHADGVPERVEVYASGGLGTTPEQVAQWNAEQEAAGHRTVKFRAMRDPQTTIDLMHAIVPKLAPTTRFCLDAVQGCASSPWSVEDAILVGREAAALGARWYEEPCAAEDHAGYAAVRKAVDTDVTGVESHSVLEDFLHLIDAGGVDIAQPDLSMIGGWAQFRRVAEHAAARGIGCVPHVWGSGVQLMTSLHAAIAAGLPLVEMCTLLNPMRDATMTAPLKVVDGHVTVPTGPGAGGVLPERAEEVFPYRPGAGMVIR